MIEVFAETKEAAMPKNDDEKFNFIPAAKLSAEWRKDPEFARRADAKIAKLMREIEANKARRARRKAVVAWVRGVWAYLTRGVGGEVL
ncbi:MAG: hypothetical protein MJE68_09740 [Proteobacteria bacterium]|nr:hypothetical protein [Pseudomonadota bacterium]